MEKSRFKKLYLRLMAIIVFRGVLKKPLFVYLTDYARSESAEDKIKVFASVTAKTFSTSNKKRILRNYIRLFSVSGRNLGLEILPTHLFMET